LPAAGGPLVTPWDCEIKKIDRFKFNSGTNLSDNGDSFAPAFCEGGFVFLD